MTQSKGNVKEQTYPQNRAFRNGKKIKNNIGESFFMMYQKEKEFLLDLIVHLDLSI